MVAEPRRNNCPEMAALEMLESAKQAHMRRLEVLEEQGGRRANGRKDSKIDAEISKIKAKLADACHGIAELKISMDENSGEAFALIEEAGGFYTAGKRHGEAAKNFAWLAGMHCMAGRGEIGLEFYKRAIESYAKENAYLEIKNVLAQVMETTGKYGLDRRELCGWAMEGLKKALENAKPEKKADIFGCLGWIENAQVIHETASGNYASALEHYADALAHLEAAGKYAYCENFHSASLAYEHALEFCKNDVKTTLKAKSDEPKWKERMNRILRAATERLTGKSEGALPNIGLVAERAL
ncbi:MAG: hypothetical protein PHS02_04220 [Candidatus ainarchaeum sp.]|nr:hypothetical protein [Candidatus ainarchaeum sp.]